MSTDRPAPTTYVGIDSAAATLAVVVRAAPGAAPPARPYANAADGGRQLQATLIAQGARPAATRLVMEAPGASRQGLAAALVAGGWAMSVVSPASARAYAKATGRRAKTDAGAAAMLAAYGRARQPARWPPAPADVQVLQGLLRQRDDLGALQTETRNRRHARGRLPAAPPAVGTPRAAGLAGLAQQTLALEAAIRRHAASAASVAADIARLQTIVGVGLLTAAVVVAEARPRRARATPAQVVAYAGLDPAPREAGPSVRGGTHISKAGNARLRQAVSLAAGSAVRFNPPLRAVDERLVARGKPKKLALVAAARKLVVLMVSLLHNGRDFDPTWAATHPPRRP